MPSPITSLWIFITSSSLEDTSFIFCLLSHVNLACLDIAAYCVVAVDSVVRQIPITLLKRLKEDFTKRCAKRCGDGKASTAVCYSLNRDFASKLKKHMKNCVEHPEDISKLAKVNAQVSEIKGAMMLNIEKVHDRGEKIELLADKTENVRSQAQDFRQQGTKLRKEMWWQNMKMKLIVLAIIADLLLIMILSTAMGSNALNSSVHCQSC